jgi:hypothetical protein
MLVYIDHDRIGGTIVALLPILAIGDAAFDFWHTAHLLVLSLFRRLKRSMSEK